MMTNDPYRCYQLLKLIEKKQRKFIERLMVQYTAYTAENSVINHFHRN